MLLVPPESLVSQRTKHFLFLYFYISHKAESAGPAAKGDLLFSSRPGSEVLKQNLASPCLTIAVKRQLRENSQAERGFHVLTLTVGSSAT